MKRIVLIIGILLVGLAVQAQSVTYTCRYWFDQNFAQAATTTFSDQTCQAELDVGSLSEGLHALHLHVMDTSMKWSAPQSYLFFKADTWENGMPNYVYHCWFDEDFANQQTDALGSGHLLLDVNDLEEGLHTVNVMLQGSTYTATQSYMFMKMAVEDPSAELQYICWFDQDYSSAQTGPLGSGLFELEVGDLPNGIHTVNVQLDNGTRTAPQCYLFYKQPLGGYGITRWEYWLNDDIANRQITNISPSLDTLDIVSLLNVGHPALRSSCFHFHPNGDAPYINAKNQINFRFYDSELRIMDKSAYYVDEQVQQDIVATVFERNTTETFAAPRNNQITWYKLDAVVGDSLAFVADKACTMQLFAPSGEEVYLATASEAMVFGGCHAWEDGTYYLAVHDVTGSGDQISVTYQYVHKYAVLAYDVHLVGNGGCSTITFQGNGFNSLLDSYLVNYQNDTIHRLDIGHESNTTTTVTFNFYEVNLGVYDAVFQFYDETIHINGALEVQEPVDIVLSSIVNYPSQYLRNTVVTYTYSITNNGNMSAYAVPIYLYISTESIDCISHLELEGLGLLELKDYFNTDSLTQDELQELARWSKEMGDDHYFFKVYGVDETTGDTILIRSNYFFINLAPYETKEIKVKITSDCSNNVWMTIPSEVGYDYDPYPPLTYNPNDPNNPNGNNPGGGSGGSGDDPGGGSGGSGGDPGGGSGGSGGDPGGGSGGSGGDPGGGSGGSGGDPGGGSGGSGGDPGGGSGGSGGNPGGGSGDPGGNPGGGSGDPGGNSPGGGPENCCVNEKLQCTMDLVCSGLDIASIIPGGWGIAAGVAGCVCDAISLGNQVYNIVLCPGNYDDDYWDALKNAKAGVSIGGTIASCIAAFSPEGKFKNILSGIGALLNGMTLGDLINPVGDCVQAWMSPQPDCPPGDPKGGESTPVNSLDPNDIRGYLSESGSHYMRQEIQNVQYEIEFENDTTLATAAAHTILVRDTLDATKFDLSSLAARSVTIGDKRLDLNGEQTFARTLDMRPELYVIAQVEQDYDPTTGIIQWTIQSLDPMTMEPTDDPNQGVLPVNYYGNGVGFIDYSINLKQAFVDGTEISNRAGIIFDQEEVIMTPIWTNIVDAVKPTSQIESVEVVNDSLSFNLVSSDNRSGVWYHTLYYRNISTEQEWQVKKAQIFGNGFMLKPDLMTTEFLIMAVDSAGNVEDKDMVAEYVHYYDGPEPTCQTIPFALGWNWFSTNVDTSLDDLKSSLLETLPNTSITIKGKSGSTKYIVRTHTWNGTLDWDITKMYKINVPSACEITLEGAPIIPADHPVTIVNGPNWIGYPLTESMTVTSAFANFGTVNGDVVKSKSGSSRYWNGSWRPNGLNTLEPGQGYIFNSAATGERTLVFPSGAK